MARVLLADSQPLFHEALFSRDDAHQVLGRCSSAEDAFSRLQPPPRPAAGRHPRRRGRGGGQDLWGQHRAAGRRMVSRERMPDSPLSRLSPRERQALALLSRGWDNPRIGRDLPISQHTVRTHIQNILERLGMHAKLEAATCAMQRSLELELTPGGAGSDH